MLCWLLSRRMDHNEEKDVEENIGRNEITSLKQISIYYVMADNLDSLGGCFRKRAG